MSTLSSKSKRIMDVDTGEVTNITELLVTREDFDFDKIWVLQMATILDLAGSKPIQVLSWFLSHRNADNLAIGTYEKIAQDTNTSPETVKRTVKVLLKAGAFTKVQIGVYRVNPDLIWRGGHGRRQAILIEYRREGGADITPIKKEAPKEVTEADLLARLKGLDLQAEQIKEHLVALAGRKSWGAGGNSQVLGA